eukprot:CAMPEP_0206544700 /NCGR_PEP_ID=MMETSP0325_2-20121206/11695_1 /ASSEMBLY_ACC=CAM_ASM_000347 /TAXON_ID=2866 /ORGANISM="Crypthecodinium cohnii, Strain Seligo" /LENGTH=541 /DNA_ID=CAMNT_0054043541 /DNA_START=234 /DNA_END=1859 /DNA_ORIENTATION=+
MTANEENGEDVIEGSSKSRHLDSLKQRVSFSSVRLSIRSVASLSDADTSSQPDNIETMDQDLLRGMSKSLTFDLASVMRGCGSIFSASQGTMATFDLSVPARRIKYFISHNWSVSRWDKFTALALTFNFHFMAVIMLFTLGTIAVLSLLGLAPELETRSDTKLSAGFLARMTVVPISFCVLLFGRDLCSIFGWIGPLTFLDKACIHQVDEGLKGEGIEKLGAFLRISDRMLILYGEAYCRKLWTVYEVANFLIFNTVTRLDVMPVLLPRIVFCAIPLFFANALLTMFLRSCCDVHWTMYVCVFVSSVTYAILCRRWALHKAETQTRLKNFEVRDCVCAVESDRKIIYGKIAGLMRISRRVEREASLEECLTAFNEMVRGMMPVAFKVMFGPNMLSYPHYLLVGSILSAPTAVDELTRLQYEPAQTIKGFCRDAFWCITGYPIAMWCTEVMVGRFPHWRGCRQVFLLLGTIIGLMIPGIAVDTVMDFLEHRSEPWALWAMIAITSFTTLSTILVDQLLGSRAGKKILRPAKGKILSVMIQCN